MTEKDAIYKSHFRQLISDGINQLKKRKIQINKDTKTALVVGIQISIHYQWEVLRHALLDHGLADHPKIKMVLRDLDIDFR